MGVCERQRERERGREKERKREREGVCVCERERGCIRVWFDKFCSLYLLCHVHSHVAQLHQVAQSAGHPKPELTIENTPQVQCKAMIDSVHVHVHVCVCKCLYMYMYMYVW